MFFRMEGNRQDFRLECWSNRAGRYRICSVRNGDGKRHKIFIPEGKGLVRGWEVLAEKLQELGTVERQLEKRIKEGGQALKGIVEKNSSLRERDLGRGRRKRDKKRGGDIEKMPGGKLGPCS